MSDAVPGWGVGQATNAADCPQADGQVVLQGGAADWRMVTAGSAFGACPIEGVPAAVSTEFDLCTRYAARDTVLGAAAFAPNGAGFGHRKPRRIFNGGAPSGIAKAIHWHGWGRKVATGRGKAFLYKPRGGYYKRPGRIVLRASHKGRCGADGSPAYTRLRARVAKRPGGKLGRWFDWAGAKTICHI